MSLPTLPAETVAISPEYMEVANAYMTLQDTSRVAEQLDIPTEVVVTILDRREVQSYMNRVFSDVGYNNRMKMRELLDTLIAQKLQEMMEAGVGSNKDIMDILALSHKFTMEYLEKELALKKLESGKPNNQFNVQINNDNSNYEKLIERLIGGNNVGD